jgi:hypothetical protein
LKFNNFIDTIKLQIKGEIIMRQNVDPNAPLKPPAPKQSTQFANTPHSSFQATPATQAKKPAANESTALTSNKSYGSIQPTDKRHVDNSPVHEIGSSDKNLGSSDKNPCCTM